MKTLCCAGLKWEVGSGFFSHAPPPTAKQDKLAVGSRSPMSYELKNFNFNLNDKEPNTNMADGSTQHTVRK